MVRNYEIVVYYNLLYLRNAKVIQTGLRVFGMLHTLKNLTAKPPKATYGRNY